MNIRGLSSNALTHLTCHLLSAANWSGAALPKHNLARLCDMGRGCNAGVVALRLVRFAGGGD